MSAEAPLLGGGWQQLLSGLLFVFYGVLKEKHYAQADNMIINVLGLIVSVTALPFLSVDFAIIAAFILIGFVVMGFDIYRQYNNPVVEFLLGAKTLGAIAIVIGIHQVGFIDMFRPAAEYLIVDKSTITEGFIEFVAILIVIASAWILGGIAIWREWSFRRIFDRSIY
jgi:hypothetical protein